MKINKTGGVTKTTDSQSLTNGVRFSTRFRLHFFTLYIPAILATAQILFLRELPKNFAPSNRF